MAGILPQVVQILAQSDHDNLVKSPAWKRRPEMAEVLVHLLDFWSDLNENVI